MIEEAPQRVVMGVETEIAGVLTPCVVSVIVLLVTEAGVAQSALETMNKEI